MSHKSRGMVGGSQFISKKEKNREKCRTPFKMTFLHPIYQTYKSQFIKIEYRGRRLEFFAAYHHQNRI